MLLVDVRQLHEGPVSTEGQLAADDPLFADLGLDLAGPVRISGSLAETGTEEYFWRAHVAGRLRGACRRCLAEVEYPLEQDIEVLFSADPDAADDPAVYPVEAPVIRIDVRPAVREEVALAASAFPLCREDCAGLCPRCGTDLNTGPCGCAAPSR